MSSASMLRRPPSALSGAAGCRRPVVVAVAIGARSAAAAPSSAPRPRHPRPARRRPRATPGHNDDAPDDPNNPQASPPSLYPDLFGTDDPPPGPEAMAALLRELAAASTAAELQAALLSFLPRHMLEDAEEEDEAKDASEQQRQPPPRDWGAQFRAMAAGGQPQPKPAEKPDAAAAAAAGAPTTPPPPPSLPRALELMLRRPADEQPLDSFALRHLVLTRPRALEPLSAFSASPSRYVQRVAVLGATGERAVLTFTLARRGVGRRARRHAATNPTSAGAAAHWFLVRVEGEQDSGDATGSSSSSSSELAPETVVALQLDALGKGDVDGAFSLTSPVGRAVAGDLPRFRHLLSSDARFRPLLKHKGWASLRRTQSIARSFVEVVAVRPGGGGGGDGGGGGGGGGGKEKAAGGEEEEAVYAVIASLHPDAEGDKASERWMIDYFAPILDKALLRTLGAARPTAD